MQINNNPKHPQYSLMNQIINSNQTWQSNYQEFIDNLPTDPQGFLKMKVGLQVMGQQISTWAQIVRHQMEDVKKINKTDY